MAARPTVTVYSAAGAPKGSAPLPAVFTAPIRRDVVHFVHTNLAKNARQAYAVNRWSGMQVRSGTDASAATAYFPIPREASFLLAG